MRFRNHLPTNMPRRCCARASSAFALCGFRESSAAGDWRFMDSERRRTWRFKWRDTGAWKCTPRTRGAKHQQLALELGAVWAGEAAAEPPAKLDAAIIFAPAGELVPPALAALKKGGVLVLGGIHMSPIPSFDYDLLYQERVIRSVANNTRQDGEDFLRVAAEIPIHSQTTLFPLRDANRALNDLKSDRINGAAVLDCTAMKIISLQLACRAPCAMPVARTCSPASSNRPCAARGCSVA